MEVRIQIFDPARLKINDILCLGLPLLSLKCLIVLFVYSTGFEGVLNFFLSIVFILVSETKIFGSILSLVNI